MTPKLEIDDNAFEKISMWVHAHTAFLAATYQYNQRIQYISDREKEFPETFGKENADLEYNRVVEARDMVEEAIQAMYSSLTK